MGYRRWKASGTITAFGGVLLGLGLLLALVKLVMFVAWFAAGAFLLAGMVLLIVGMILGQGRGTGR